MKKRKLNKNKYVNITYKEDILGLVLITHILVWKYYWNRQFRKIFWSFKGQYEKHWRQISLECLNLTLCFFMTAFFIKTFYLPEMGAVSISRMCLLILLSKLMDPYTLQVYASSCCVVSIISLWASIMLLLSSLLQIYVCLSIKCLGVLLFSLLKDYCI